MPDKLNLHTGVFWFCLFFMAGIVLIVVFNNVYFALTSAFLAFFCFLLLKRNGLAFLLLAAILGIFYFRIYSYFQFSDVNIPFGKEMEFTGIVNDVSRSDSAQTLIIELAGEFKGSVSVRVKAYPEFEYGDLVKFIGAVNSPQEEYKNYYLLHGISGEANFPNIELIGKGGGNFIKSALLNLREGIKNIFKENLPKEKAAFLTGITIGGKEDFSKDLKNKMSLSGTTHLVAISGYNISIIIWIAGLLFASIFSATLAFYLSVFTIILFVIMTGAEASVVRAAVMGGIVLLSGRAERLYNPRNAVIITAFVMMLINPTILIFDAGFQLSFAALLGIIYLSPAIKNLLKLKPGSFLSWKDNAIVTASAQIMAMPILIFNFGIFSLSSLFANILILEFVPMTMGLGFIMAGFGFFSGFLAKMAGVLANMFISYDFFVIDIFSKFSLILPIKNVNFIFVLVYYLAVFIFINIYKESNGEKI
jgi:competence protein ComEC